MKLGYEKNKESCLEILLSLPKCDREKDNFQQALIKIIGYIKRLKVILDNTKESSERYKLDKNEFERLQLLVGVFYQLHKVLTNSDLDLSKTLENKLIDCAITFGSEHKVTQLLNRFYQDRLLLQVK